MTVSVWHKWEQNSTSFVDVPCHACVVTLSHTSPFIIFLPYQTLKLRFAYQLSSRKIDRRQKQHRVQSRVRLHLPTFLLNLHSESCKKKKKNILIIMWLATQIMFLYPKHSQTSVIRPTITSPTSPLNLKNTKPITEWYHVKFNMHIRQRKVISWAKSRRKSHLVFRGLTQMSLLTRSTSPATEAVSFSSSMYVPWPLNRESKNGLN